MKEIASESIDSIVTDPPYELGFMGKKWDATGIANDVTVWQECLRVLKPGGHLLAFSGTRTYHRMVCSIEDAGFDIRDQIQWVYGSGFPKSHNLENDWDGWGTALKPAQEPIVLARKPFKGTVAENVQKYGVGALNIDACRIALQETGEDSRLGGKGKWKTDKAAKNVYVGGYAGTEVGSSAKGRWPANFIHDGSQQVLDLLPESKGQQGDVKGTEKSRTGGEGTNCYGEYDRIATPKRGDSGSAARFFYCPKASKKDRDEGLEDLTPQQYSHDGRDKPIENAYQRNNSVASNNHPTVKPTALMQYLCRLITPPGGKVLDPFAGSGSTGKAAVREGFEFIGIELEPEYAAIATIRAEQQVRTRDSDNG